MRDYETDPNKVEGENLDKLAELIGLKRLEASPVEVEFNIEDARKWAKSKDSNNVASEVTTRRHESEW